MKLLICCALPSSSYLLGRCQTSSDVLPWSGKFCQTSPWTERTAAWSSRHGQPGQRQQGRWSKAASWCLSVVRLQDRMRRPCWMLSTTLLYQHCLLWPLIYILTCYSLGNLLCVAVLCQCCNCTFWHHLPSCTPLFSIIYLPNLHLSFNGSTI